jgi:N-acyl-D-amino-acid deacylase
VLAPGFIDLHNHSANALLSGRPADSQIAQGVTTVFVGADGSSALPIRDYLDALDSTPLSLNVGTFVGHGSIRRSTMGDDYRRPAVADEIHRMVAMARRNLQDGAFGVSSGLEYDPGFYAETDELIAVAAEAGKVGGLYMSHIRDEEERLLAAIDEAVRIGRSARVKVQISHLKAGNASVWGAAPTVLERMRAARELGVDMAADQYPYTAWQSSLSIVVPSRRFDDPDAVAAGIAAAGGAGRLQIVDVPAEPELAGLRLDAIARRWGVDPVQAYMRLMRDGGTGVIGHTMDEEDVLAFMRSPLVMTASDGGIDGAHPRGAGSFARVLGTYVRELGVLPLERAIERATSQPASRVGLRDRGVVREGAIADLVAFDPAAIAAPATFEEPHRLAVGVVWTWVGGQAVWRDGAATAARPGQVLRRR